ncbi:MAG: hypothetical protein HYR56_25855 [Acidobacteria bacterium]|nr:hypothetical protein [Acidobacteriota bacterium]MBI3425094.1 hypothetical protein [Acidobacteriota bacterium]
MSERLPKRIWLLLSVLWLALAGLACRQTTAPPREAMAHEAMAQKAAPAATPQSVAVHTEVGFASRQKFQEHFAKHGREFGAIKADEYLRQAQTLRDRPASKDVLEVVRADGVIARFDQQSGAFVAFNQDLTIRTYFKPNDGVNYFWRQSRR